MATKQDIPILEAASKLGVHALVQVNALERIDVQPGRDARFERRFYRATRAGERGEAARVATELRGDFESLIGPKEARLVRGKRVGATINVSAVWVDTGATMWFYEWSRIDEAVAEPVVEVVADCDDDGCSEVGKLGPVESDGLVQGSISGISLSGDPEDESQAIFQGLVRALVTDLAERFAGRRS
jgi:heme-degrading monooxygenase HmoA